MDRGEALLESIGADLVARQLTYLTSIALNVAHRILQAN